jgi:hypothetical protein
MNLAYQFLNILKQKEVMTFALACTILVPSCRKKEDDWHESSGGAIHDARFNDRMKRNRPMENAGNSGTVIRGLFEKYSGTDLMERTFLIFCDQQSKTSMFLLARITTDNDPLAIRTLGYCCGRTGQQSWLAWLRENLNDEQYGATKIGYFEGLAMIGSSEVIDQWEKLEADNAEKDMLMSVVLLMLSEKDPQDAEDLLYYWVGKSPDRLWAKNPAIIKVLEKMLKDSGPFLDKMIYDGRFLTLCQGNMRRVAIEIAKLDPERARVWALERSSDIDRIAAVNGVLIEEATKESNDKVMDSIRKFSASGKVPVGNMLRDVLLCKMARNSIDGEAWIDTIGENNAMYDQCCGVFVAKWSEEDQMAVSQWISELPVGRKRDISAFHLASSLKSAADAITWGSSITDVRLREALFKQIVTRFGNNNVREIINDDRNMIKLSPSEFGLLDEGSKY